MPWRRWGFSGLADGEQGLDGAAFVPGPVGVGDVVEVGAVVEDEARVEVACKDVLEQLGNVPTRGRNTALDADVLPEQSLVLEVLVEGNADGTDHAAGTRDGGAGLSRPRRRRAPRRCRWRRTPWRRPAGRGCGSGR